MTVHPRAGRGRRAVAPEDAEPQTAHDDHDLHGLLLGILPDGSVQIEDEDCDCPVDCASCADSPYVVRPVDS